MKWEILERHKFDVTYSWWISRDIILKRYIVHESLLFDDVYMFLVTYTYRHKNIHTHNGAHFPLFQWIALCEGPLHSRELAYSGLDISIDEYGCETLVQRTNFWCENKSKILIENILSYSLSLSRLLFLFTAPFFYSLNQKQ